MPRKKSAAKKAKEAAQKVAIPEEIKVNASKTITQETEGPKKAEEHDLDSESSTSEEEDDYGELVTEEVENGINQVLEAIKSNDTSKLLDPKVRFFEDPQKAVEKMTKSEKHKPIYLKDYHRMNILSGNTFMDDDDDVPIETVDGKQSFVSQQKEEKAQLLGEIKEEFGDSDADEDEGDFLVKKVASARERVDTSLPNPEVDDEKFLDQFVSKHAWIPKKGDRTINLDGNQMEEDDEEFDDAAERFENAYNFRYEDPNAAEIVSYARNQATLRRSDTNSRRKKREGEKQMKEREMEEKEAAVQRKKKDKINKLTDVLEQVKKEYGAEINEEIVEKLTKSLLKGEFDDSQWDTVLGELFNDEFYSQESKPNWDENDEIMADFYQGKEESADGEENEQSGEEIDEPLPRKSRKAKIDEKKSKKKEKKRIADMVGDAVEKNKISIIGEVEEERKSRSKTREEQEMKFRYREVSPESFGLTAREIIAADDTDLNEFIGLKKFAPYRPKELRAKDRRKVMKSRRVRDWRKKVFGKEEGLGEDDQIRLPISEESSGSIKKIDKKRKNRKN